MGWLWVPVPLTATTWNVWPPAPSEPYEVGLLHAAGALLSMVQRNVTPVEASSNTKVALALVEELGGPELIVGAGGTTTVQE